MAGGWTGLSADFGGHCGFCREGSSQLGSQAFLGSQSLWGARVDVEGWQGKGHIVADPATGGDI